MLLYLLDAELQTNKTNPNFIYIKKAYHNVAEKLKEHKILSKADIAKLDITENMRNKLMGFMDVKLNDADKKIIKDRKLHDELINIAGIGKAKADELIKAGLTNINQLKQKKWDIPKSVLLMIKTKPLKKIPYSFIASIENVLTGFAGAKLVGGFIRKKPFSKDIDVMVVGEKDYIKYLENHFEIHVYASGPGKISLVARIKNIYVKIDIFKCSREDRHAMLLYATGSKQFNIKMRGIARRQGYLLNQYGLFKDDKKIKVKSERDFFKILKIPYVEPQYR